MVLKTPATVSPVQLATFRAVASAINRPVQPLNGRIVYSDVIQ